MAMDGGKDTTGLAALTPALLLDLLRAAGLRPRAASHGASGTRSVAGPAAAQAGPGSDPAAVR